MRVITNATSLIARQDKAQHNTNRITKRHFACKLKYFTHLQLLTAEYLHVLSEQDGCYVISFMHKSKVKFNKTDRSRYMLIQSPY